MKDTEIKRLAEQITDDLFVNGQGDEAQRLVLTMDKPTHRDLGGWSKSCMVDRIVRVLKAKS